MRADKRHATFGAAYWRRPHPGVGPYAAWTYDCRRAFRRAAHFHAALLARLTAAVDDLAQSIPNGWPEWPDAQRVQAEDYDDPDWTLGRIDAALDQHQATQ